MTGFPSVRFPTDPQLNVRTVKARLDPSFRPATLDVDVERGGYQMKFSPAKVEIDNSPYFDSVNLKSIEALAEDYVAAAKQAARDASVRACKDGTAVAEGASIGALAFMQTTKSIDRMLTCVQPQRPEITCREARLEVNYVKDAYTFSWDTGGAGAVYYPYSVNMWVEFQNKK